MFSMTLSPTDTKLCEKNVDIVQRDALGLGIECSLHLYCWLNKCLEVASESKKIQISRQKLYRRQIATHNIVALEQYSPQLFSLVAFLFLYPNFFRIRHDHIHEFVKSNDSTFNAKVDIVIKP